MRAYALGSSDLEGGRAPLTRRSLVKATAATLLIGGTLKSPLAYAASTFVLEQPPSRLEPKGKPDPVIRDMPKVGAMPAWFGRDVRRQARWLPNAVKRLGVDAAFEQRWNAFPEDIRAILGQMAIPPWMIALVPTTAEIQDEIFKQFRFMADLAGPPPANKLAARAEQLLIFGGAAQLPTPGDRVTGACLGPEGCSAAMSKYVLAQLKLEFPRELARMSDALAESQSSVEMKALFEHAARTGMVRIESRPFQQLRPEDVQPGCFTIAQKPGGTHVFGWTRVPAGWNWYPGDKMAIGNTGLPQYGDRMILAQEYVSGNSAAPGEIDHNRHGPINSRSIVYVGGQPDLGDPRTNVYAARGSDFILINLI